MTEDQVPHSEDEAVKNGILLWIEYLIERASGETTLSKEEWLDQEIAKSEE